jgi:hypothetical protein
VSDRETLLDNENGSIMTDGPFVLVCKCPGGVLEPFIRLISGMAMILTAIVCIIVALRAAPRLLLSIVAVWTVGVVVANVIARKESRKHGVIRIDTDCAQIVQQGRGFSCTYSFSDITRISTPVVVGMESSDSEPGFERRWLLVELAGGKELRLAQGAMHELRPAVAFLRKAGAPRMK